MKVYRKKHMPRHLAEVVFRIREHVLYSFWVRDVARMVGEVRKPLLGRMSINMREVAKQVWN